VRCARQVLASDAAGDAHPGAQYPANGLRSHSIYDGSSDAW
jgi:hypothetical protein